MLGIAQRYYALGFTPIPCEPRSKKPVCEWAQWQYRRPSWEELEVVWHNAIKRFGDQINIATILGKAHGLCAVDIDNPQAFRQARQAIGLTEDDLRTWITLSHRGGALIFRYPKSHDLPSKVSNEQLGAELHGDRHLRMLPPSIHPEGTPYRWLKGHEPDQIPLVDIPEPLLFAFIGERPKPTPRSVTPPQNGHGDGNELPSWAHAVVALLRPYWQEGWRHDTALALAGTLAKRGVPKEVAENILRELVWEANDPEIKDRLRALMDTYERLAEGESILAWQGLEQLLDEETLKILDRLLPNSPRSEHNNMSSKRLPNAVWIPLREITRADPNERWQVDGLIKAGNLVILSARPKTAKSIVALNLAACIAMGKSFLNRSTVQGRALFVAWERHDLTVQRAFAMGLDACEDFMVWDKRRFGVAPRVDALDWWREFIVTNDIRFVVFDTLAYFLRPELDKVRNALNAYDYIGSVLERVAQVANETGCTFVFIHHDRKGEGDTDEQRVLGTTALTAAADVVLQLQPLSDYAGVTALKVTGNAIDDQTLYFAIQSNFWLEPTERPAVTKEERAANAIEGYLRRHGEAKRKELERHLQEVGLAESPSAAEKLFDRAVVLLQGKVVRTQRGIYILQSDLKHPDDTIENVGFVGNSEPNSDIPDIPDMSEMSEMSETPLCFPTKQTAYIVSSENRNGHGWHRDLLASDTPILPDLLISENPTTPCHHDRIRSENDIHCPSSFELPTNTPEPTEPAYTTPRGNEPVNAPITETPNTTSSDEVRYVDTKQWLEELFAELSETSNKPDDNASLASQPKPDRLACLCGGELRLFGKFYQCLRCDSPRIAACRYCGKVLQLTSDSHAECVGCGLPYTFDRARRLWLSDLDAF
jgi:hypothetical protein